MLLVQLKAIHNFLGGGAKKIKASRFSSIKNDNVLICHRLAIILKVSQFQVIFGEKFLFCMEFFFVLLNFKHKYFFLVS